MQKKHTLAWLLLGLGAEFQIYFSLSFTEIYVFLAAVIMLPKEYVHMRETGVIGLFWLSILVILGGVISMFIYPTDSYFVMRKMATVVLVTCAIVVSHSYLRRDPDGFKWFLLGDAISMVLCTFIFKQSVEVATMGVSSELIMEGPIYWIRRVKLIAMLPVSGWYLNIPIGVSVAAPAFMAVFSMIITTSGRSAALGALGFLVIAILGRKSQKSMMKMGRRFFMLIILGCISVFLLNHVYRSLALSGVLGEEATKKYESQTKGGTDVWNLLMGGRADSIAPFYLTAKEDPIFGLGLSPIDDGHRYANFLQRYGSEEDYQNYIGSIEHNAMNGRYGFFMPGHSYMGGFWMTYGIFGLLFWIYVCYVLLRYFARDAWAMPAWYGWLACGLPSLFWAIFFSPFAARVSVPMVIVACLLARAIRQGKMCLPYKMIEEISRHA